jgi:hypothetical protein
MPIVLRVDGFAVRIFLPPREHTPAHVHVLKAGGEVVIELGATDEQCRLREVHRMTDADVVRAFRIVEANLELLQKAWMQHHAK